MNNNARVVKNLGLILSVAVLVGGFVWALSATNSQVKQNTVELAAQHAMLRELLDFKAELKTDVKWIIREIGEIRKTSKHPEKSDSVQHAEGEQ